MYLCSCICSAVYRSLPGGALTHVQARERWWRRRLARYPGVSGVDEKCDLLMHINQSSSSSSPKSWSDHHLENSTAVRIAHCTKLSEAFSSSCHDNRHDNHHDHHYHLNNGTAMRIAHGAKLSQAEGVAALAGAGRPSTDVYLGDVMFVLFCLFTCLFGCLFIFLVVCLLACLFACCLFVCLPAWEVEQHHSGLDLPLHTEIPK